MCVHMNTEYCILLFVPAYAYVQYVYAGHMLHVTHTLHNGTVFLVRLNFEAYATLVPLVRIIPYSIV
jgi:hypothetical protein